MTRITEVVHELVKDHNNVEPTLSYAKKPVSTMLAARQSKVDQVIESARITIVVIAPRTLLCIGRHVAASLADGCPVAAAC